MPGQTADCGTEVNRSGDYVTCSMGTSTCRGGVWGACQGDTIYTKSLLASSIGGRHGHRHDKVVACPQGADAGDRNDPCDPNACPPVAEGPADVDAADLLGQDGGVSIAPKGGCAGLECQVSTCDGSADGTTITGRVFDPAGHNPLYNVWVYIPNDPAAPLPPFTPGVTCDDCSGAAKISAVTFAQTDANGAFTFTHAPDGANIPIVVETGKWRRKITIPQVNPCTPNAIPDGTLHLPRNRSDGDNNTADMPKIALVSGSADPFQCMLLKVGIDPNEFGSSTMNAGRAVHYYASPDSPGNLIEPAYGKVVTGDVLWNAPLPSDAGAAGGASPSLASYDLVILACEGNEYDTSDRAPTGYANLVSYANAGGRVLLSHYSYVWMKYNTPWQSVPAGWGGRPPKTPKTPCSRPSTRPRRGGRRSLRGCRTWARARVQGKSTCPRRARTRRAPPASAARSRLQPRRG